MDSRVAKLKDEIRQLEESPLSRIARILIEELEEKEQRLAKLERTVNLLDNRTMGMIRLK